MSYEMRPNSGSVFKNQRRRTDNDAVYTGSALVDGKEYWLNCWPKKDKNGDTWKPIRRLLLLSVTMKFRFEQCNG